MDITNKKVLVIDVATKALTTSYTVPDPGCSNGDYRPWAIEVKGDELYIGVVCSAETSQTASDLDLSLVLPWIIHVLLL